MSAVQQWTACVCLAVLAVSLLQHFLPEGALRRMAEFTAGAFLLASFLTPLFEAAPDFSFLFPAAEQQEESTALEETVRRQEEEAVAQSVRSLVAAELAREGIPAGQVEVVVNTGEGGSICISKVAVTLPADCASLCGRAAGVLSGTLGLQAEVTADDTA